jgi:hypothetical protein
MFTNATRTSIPNVCVNGAFVPLLSETNEIEINGLNENNVKSACQQELEYRNSIYNFIIEMRKNASTHIKERLI